MIDYPEAYAILSKHGGWIQQIYDTPDLRVLPGDSIVRLIPAPVVERMIAEAEQRGRDAERERCIKQIETRGDGTEVFFGPGYFVYDDLTDAIRSGIEPGKVGE